MGPNDRSHPPRIGRRAVIQFAGIAATTSLSGCVSRGAQPATARATPGDESTRRGTTPAFVMQPQAPARLADYTAKDWDNTRAGKSDWMSRLPDRVLGMLRDLEGLYYGNAVDQLQHSLQTATRAYRANADDELVLVALCHDAGKAITLSNHAAIAAELLRPFVSGDNYQIARAHTEFQARFWLDRSTEYMKYKDEPWFSKAVAFSTDWDQESMDPKYPTLPLGHFEPLVRERLAKPRIKTGATI